MIQRFKKALKKEDNKRIFSNFVSLSFLQGANLILPLITFPYLVRVLGVDKYGLILFAQAFISYFTLLSEYGFNLSGAREVSINRTNLKELTKIFNSILILRLGFAFFGFVMMSGIVLYFDKFAEDWELYFVTYSLVFGPVLFPIWFFQGIQKMKYITVLSLVAKFIFTVSIFLVVNSPDDYLLVPLMNSLGYILVGIISLGIINRQFGISFKLQKVEYLAKQLKKGWYIFISNISTNLYTSTTTFVLGIATNNTMVGYYVIAEKVIRIIQGLFSPIVQAIYPHVVQLTEKSKKESILFIRKILKYTILVSLGIWVIGVFFTEPIFHLVFNDDVDNSIFLFRILSPLIIILPIAGILFHVVLLSFKMDKYFFKIYVTGAILNIGLLGVFLFVLKLETVGACISLLICELVITFYAAILLYRNDLKVFNFLDKQ